MFDILDMKELLYISKKKITQEINYENESLRVNVINKQMKRH